MYSEKIDFETALAEGICDDCEHDCAKCAVDGYCHYHSEKENTDEHS